MTIVSALRCALLSPAALLGVTLVVGCDSPPSPVVGVSTSSSFMDAARLAIADAADQGRLLDLDTLMIGEGSNASAPAVQAARRFVETPGLLAVVGHSNSAASLAASQIYNQHGIVQIAPHSSAVVYSRAGPWSFRLVPPDEAQSRFLAQAVPRLLPEGGDVAILYVNDDYGRGLHEGFTAALDTTRHPVVLEYPHTEEEGLEPETVESTVAALADAAPDLLVWIGRATILHGYLPRIEERLPDLPVLGTDGLASAPYHENEDGRWDGVRYVDFVDLQATPELQAFARRYASRFEGRATGPDALTYDAVGLVATAVADGARTPANVREWLMSLGRSRPPWQGITGPVEFDEDGDVSRSYVLRRVRDEP